MTLGAATGIIMVATAPRKNVLTVIARRPIISYKKPMTITVGIAIAYAYVKLFAVTLPASSEFNL